MADVGDARYCNNCKRDIATVNFVMHEVHCHRNIVLCATCDEPVPKSELERHFNDLHAPVTCHLCGQAVDKSTLDSHKEYNCMKRPKTCCFCELDLSFDTLREHQDACGSRTERCPKCHQYVMLKDQCRHDDTNCAYPAPRSATNQRTCDDEFLMPLDDAGFFAYTGFTPLKANTSDWEPTGLSSPTWDTTHLYPMNHSKKALTNAERSRVNTRDGGCHQIAPQNVNRTFLNSELSRDITRTSDVNDLLCDVGDGPVNRHMQYLTSSLARDLCHPNHASNDTKCETLNEALPEDLTSLPCEFCGDAFPADCLLLHQDSCTNGLSETHSPTANISTDVLSNWLHSGLPNHQLASGDHGNHIPHLIGNNTLPSGSGVVNRRPLVFEDNLSINSPFLERLSPDVSHDLEDPTLMLPCEFCDVLLREDMLIQHQADCTAGDLDLSRPSNGCQQPHSHAASSIHPQQPWRHPQPSVSNKKTETGSKKMNRTNETRRHSNNSLPKKNRVWGANGDGVPHTAPRWRNQRPQDGEEGGHVASRRRHSRPENNEDIATKCPGVKSRETSTPSQRDVVPGSGSRSGSAARNIAGNRANHGIIGTARRSHGGALGGSQGRTHAGPSTDSSVMRDDTAVSVPLAPSPTHNDINTTLVTPTRPGGRGREYKPGHPGAGSILRDINSTPSYEASFASGLTGGAAARPRKPIGRAGGGLTNSQKQTKSGNRDGAALLAGTRGRNRNKTEATPGSRRLP